MTTFAAKCGNCGHEFSCPVLSDFAYGSFLFTGECGTVFAHFFAIDHPVWDFMANILPSVGEGDAAESRQGDRIQAACAHFADPVEGQRLVNKHVCPACRSSTWEWWGGAETGVSDVAEVSYVEFMCLPEAERRHAVWAFDSGGGQ